MAIPGGRVPDTIATILATLPIGAEIGDATRRAIADHVIDYLSGQPRPILEAVEAARKLHSPGIPPAVASSSARRFIDIVIRSLGLEDAIPIRASALDVLHGKPAPATCMLP